MDLPKIPKQLQPMTMDEAVDEFTAQGESPKARIFEGETWCEEGPSFLEWDGCCFTGCRLAGSRVRQGRFFDVVFENCDLSNVDWREVDLLRVRFQNCKMVGGNLAELTAHHVEFIQCNLQYANLNDGAFQEVLFAESNLKQTGF